MRKPNQIKFQHQAKNSFEHIALEPKIWRTVSQIVKRFPWYFAIVNNNSKGLTNTNRLEDLKIINYGLI